MPGTKAGGLRAAETNRLCYGKGFYKRIGALGGRKSVGGGFHADPELARLAGQLGGMTKKNKGRLYSSAEWQMMEDIKAKIKARRQARVVR